MDVKETEATVIGAGPGGYPAAIRLAQLGVDTMLLDRGNPGGVCLNWGCIPSKAFIHASNVMEEIENADQMGIQVGDPELDMEQLLTWKDRIVKRLTRGVEVLLEKNGVDVHYGDASFIASDEIALVREEEEDLTVRSEQTIIATGSRPMEIPGFSFDGDFILSSKDILDLPEVPEKLVLIGGGVIGLELGTVFAKFGSDVTVVEMMDQLLPGTDPDLVQVVRDKLEDLGVTIHLESTAKEVLESDGSKSIRVETPEGEEEIPADRVLMCVGRRPNTTDIGLDTTDVTRDDNGFIETDMRMQSEDDRIYAIGDAAGQPMLAHKATGEGLAAAGAIAGTSSAADFQAIPSVIFTDPEIALTGLSEEEAREQGYDVVTGTFPLQASGRALTTNARDGFARVIADEESGLLLGLRIVSEHASELITEGTLGIEMAATLEDISFTIHPHPTLSESVMEAAEDALGMSIHKP